MDNHAYDSWNAIKKVAVQEEKISCFPKEKEVWMCLLGKNIGTEQDGTGASFSRPVLIIKKFNNQMFWVIPLSTKQKQLSFYFNFSDPYGEKVSAIVAQLRLISIKRLKRMLYTIPTDIFELICILTKSNIP